MRSCLVLSKLRRLSPLFDKLTKKALKENIRIMTRKDYHKIYSRYQSPPEADESMIMGAGNFPEMGLNKIIVVSLADIIKVIAIGNLGECEIEFAHEIAHNLSWSDEPSCNKDFSSPIPDYLGCVYFEALADRLALKILEELKKELPNWQLIFQGKNTKVLKIFQYYGFPRHYLEKIKDCQGLKLHGLKKCPKKKELEKFVKAIEQSKI